MDKKRSPKRLPAVFLILEASSADEPGHIICAPLIMNDDGTCHSKKLFVLVQIAAKSLDHFVLTTIIFLVFHFFGISFLDQLVRRSL